MPRRVSLRASLIAAAIVAVPALAVAAAPPRKIVCQLDSQGLVVEATFKPGKELQPKLRVFRKGARRSEETRISSDDVSAWQADGQLQIAVDRDVAGQTKRVLFVAWSSASTKLEAIPAAFVSTAASGSVAQENATCTVVR